MAGSLRWPDFVWLHRRYTKLSFVNQFMRIIGLFSQLAVRFSLRGREDDQYLCAVWDLGGSDRFPLFIWLCCLCLKTVFHSQMTKSTKHISYWFTGAILSLMVFSICRCTLKIFPYIHSLSNGKEGLCINYNKNHNELQYTTCTKHLAKPLSLAITKKLLNQSPSLQANIIQ